MRDMLIAEVRTIGLAALLALLGGATPALAEEVHIGSALEIDTTEIRRVIDETLGGRVPPATVPGPRLGLEEAVTTALENNLSLQIAALDRDAGEHEVPAQKAFFHPTPGYEPGRGVRFRSRREREPAGTGLRAPAAADGGHRHGGG
jgi:hypothetical protein